MTSPRDPNERLTPDEVGPAPGLVLILFFAVALCVLIVGMLAAGVYLAAAPTAPHKADVLMNANESRPLHMQGE
jgi:hypothetical protein